MSNTKFILTLVLALVLGFGGGFLAQQIGPDESTTGNLTQLKEKVAKLEEQLATVPTGNFSDAEALQSLQNDVQQLRTELNDVKDTATPSTSGGQSLDVGFLNAQNVFTIFTDAVAEQREKAQQKDEEITELAQKAQQGEIEESEFRQEYDRLQAEKLKAQLAIDLAMIDQMIEAKGFQSIRDQLEKLKDNAEPITTNLNMLLNNINSGTIDPNQAENKIVQLQNQFKQLDQLMTRVIESKMAQVANRLAQEKNYDLVFREENVVLYGNPDQIHNLTEETKQILKNELTPNA